MAIVSKVLRLASVILAGLALAAGVGLLMSDTGTPDPPGFPGAAISSAPLLLIGVSFLFAQPVMRPRWADLLKNVLLAATFLLWGIVQLMPQDGLSRRLGDVVIVLYVVDLAWVVLGLAIPPEKN